jgi:uncharacterized protein (TIGR02246 family)
MMNRRSTLTLATMTLLSLMVGLAPNSAAAQADGLRAAMEAANKQWLAAYNTPNTAAFSAMYTEDAILIPGEGFPPVRGPEAIKQFWEAGIKDGYKDHTFEIVETKSDGNLAYLLATWTVKQVREGGDTASFSGHTVRIFQRQGDGAWKTKVHMYVPLKQ